jgi:hypothetical protein
MNKANRSRKIKAPAKHELFRRRRRCRPRIDVDRGVSLDYTSDTVALPACPRVRGRNGPLVSIAVLCARDGGAYTFTRPVMERSGTCRTLGAFVLSAEGTPLHRLANAVDSFRGGDREKKSSNMPRIERDPQKPDASSMASIQRASVRERLNIAGKSKSFARTALNDE